MSLNKHIDAQQYPMPRVDELFATLAGGKKFSKVDQADAYLQIKLDKESKQYTVLTTQLGMFRINRLAFGFKSAQMIFQSAIEQVIRPLKKTGAQLDDILVNGESEDDHIENLRQLFFEVIRKRITFSPREV